MRQGRLIGVGAVLAFSVVGGCKPRDAEPTRTVVVAADSTTPPDTVGDERPDSIRSTPPDSMTMTLALLPAASNTALDGEAASLAERAVFAPRTQRWFMVRMIDSAPSVDIGRIDGGVGTTEAARAAFDRMLASRSPIQPGMLITVHPRAGATEARVTALRLSGRRIIARLDLAALDSAELAIPAEWRGAPVVPRRIGSATPCAPGDEPAIAAAIAGFVPAPKEAVSVLRGCFGDFRAMITIRPLEITPETIERVVLVRRNGKTRSGRLRDLSYPLHELVSVLDVDGDGTNEIVVHSFRMSMQTWAALRMTDSVSFTRFASGFTVESR